MATPTYSIHARYRKDWNAYKGFVRSVEKGQGGMYLHRTISASHWRKDRNQALADAQWLLDHALGEMAPLEV